MIKKIILFFVIFIASINSLISEIIKYKVISDTFYSDGNIGSNNPIKKDTTVIWKSDNRVYISYNDDETFIENFLMSVEYDNETIYMLSTDLEVIDTEKIINKKNLLRIIPDYYLEVLYKKDSNLIFENQPLWKERKQRMENEPFPFEDSFQPESYYISNPVILFSLHNYYMVKNVRKSDNNFEIDLLHYSNDVTDYYGKTEDVFSEVYNKFRSNSNIKLLIQNDGDFFDLWINTKENYIGRYIVASDSLCNQIINLVRSNNCDLSKITWPRHADGSCDYDSTNNNAAEAVDTPATEHTKSSMEAVIPKPAPAIGKTATVTENLRLRTNDKTTAKVVTTLVAGARVKVLAPGREDTVDDITSNWAQVEVLGGAKDKDGNAIAAGTVGWLFGGYLSKTEEAAESEKANKEADAKESSALPILPIAAGGAAFVILLAAILLAVKKKNYEKK